MEEANGAGAVPGAPQAVYLYADYRGEELRTLIYLCNGSKDTLNESALRICQTTLFEFVTFENEAEMDWMEVENINMTSIYPDQRILVNELSHQFWDLVNRYELTFRECETQSKKIVAYDRVLNASRLAEDPAAVQVIFSCRE